MVLRSKFFSIFGFIVIVLGFIALIIAFSTSNWVASKKSVAPSGFENMGLWVVCFHNFNPAQLLTPVATSKQYEGCLTAISYEMEVIRNHFYPSWLVGVQVMVTMSVVQTVFAIILLIITFIHCFEGHMERMLVLIAAGLNFGAALLLAISVTMFGIRVARDRSWLPQPDTTYISWSYGLAVLAMFLCTFAGMATATDWVCRRIQSKDSSHTPSSVNYRLSNLFSR